MNNNDFEKNKEIREIMEAMQVGFKNLDSMFLEQKKMISAISNKVDKLQNDVIKIKEDIRQVDDNIKSLKNDINKNEIITADNWKNIALLKSKINL